MLEIIGKTDIDFMGKRNLAFLGSGILVLLGLVAFVQIARGVANLGIDFSGGAAVQVKFDKPVEVDAVCQTRRQNGCAMLSSVLLPTTSGPPGTITGAANGLLEEKEQLGPAARHELAKSIDYNEAGQLDRLVRNLLDMTRLESGAVQLQKEWHPFEEIVRRRRGLEILSTLSCFLSRRHLA